MLLVAPFRKTATIYRFFEIDDQIIGWAILEPPTRDVFSEEVALVLFL